jgi:hypothetical protein
MSSLLESPYVASPPSWAAPHNDEASAQVRKLLAGMYPPGMLHERRREQRFPFPRLFQLTPVNGAGTRQMGSPLTAAGKHLSESGLSFFHPDPLPHRWVIASLELSESQRYGFLMDLDWCRFTRQGWYESGGRFLRAVSSPLTLGP